eukprot:scaffold1051_cov254-Pinguiococcus_pyrenoidosus.AAC.13
MHVFCSSPRRRRCCQRWNAFARSRSAASACRLRSCRTVAAQPLRTRDFTHCTRRAGKALGEGTRFGREPPTESASTHSVEASQVAKCQLALRRDEEDAAARGSVAPEASGAKDTAFAAQLDFRAWRASAYRCLATHCHEDLVDVYAVAQQCNATSPADAPPRPVIRGCARTGAIVRVSPGFPEESDCLEASA